MQVSNGIVASPLLRVDIPLASECVGFGAEFTRAETYDKVKL